VAGTDTGGNRRGAESPGTDVIQVDGGRRQFPGVVALDGPSGTGKSTVARMLARRLGVRYLDTGAMYRAATVAVLDAHTDPADVTAVDAIVSRIDLRVSTDPEHPSTRLDGRNVDVEIRAAAATASVSAVSAIARVRSIMVDRQRALIAQGPIVAEGRDIAGVVWPQAELKVYLTASEEVRARRRFADVSAGAPGSGALADVAADIRRRDMLDSSRAVSPLRRADGAREVDTTELDVDQVVDLLESLAWDAVSRR
jgi:cytidylate kinase